MSALDDAIVAASRWITGTAIGVDIQRLVDAAVDTQRQADWAMAREAAVTSPPSDVQRNLDAVDFVVTSQRQRLAQGEYLLRQVSLGSTDLIAIAGFLAAV